MALGQFKRSPQFLFLLIWAMLIIGAGIKALPRVFTDPSPYSESRYHHEYGDGGTETTILDGAHKHWNTVGYWHTKLLPCLDPDKAGGQCAPYTHYPPAPFLISSLLIKVFGDHTNGLVGARLFIFFLSTFLFALALFKLAHTFDVHILFTIVIALLVSTRRGFWVYTDNLFFLGIVTSLSALYLAYVVSQIHATQQPLRKRTLVIYSALAGLIAWLSWEPLPAITLYPLLSFVFLPTNSAKKFSFKLCMAALMGSFLTLALRLIQNSIALGGVSAALNDWTHVAVKRQGAHLTGTVMHWLLANLNQYKLLLGYIGTTTLLLVLGTLLLRKKLKELLFICAAALFVLSWNIIMIEHSGHGYTHRAVVIVLALSMFVALRKWRPAWK